MLASEYFFDLYTNYMLYIANVSSLVVLLYLRYGSFLYIFCLMNDTILYLLASKVSNEHRVPFYSTVRWHLTMRIKKGNVV